MASKHGRRALILGFLLFLAACGLAGGSIHKGQVAPDFTLADLAGNPVSLSTFQGRPVLINFWASWCPPCRSEMPELQKTYEERGDGRLVILAVNVLNQDERKEVVRFVGEMGLTFPVLLDSDGAVAAQYRVVTLPTSIFVNTQGQIHLVQVGPMTQRFVESVLREMP